MNLKLSSQQVSSISLFISGILTGLSAGYLVCKLKRVKCCSIDQPLSQQVEAKVESQPDVQL